MMIAKTAVEAFYQLVSDGQKVVGVELDRDIEAFMVYALLRNVEKTQLKDIIFAYEILENIHHQSTDKLEKVLDCSLIYAGWYPRRAQKLGLSPSYYSDIGKMASSELARYYRVIKSSWQGTYDKISTEFDKLVMVLQAFFLREEVAKLCKQHFHSLNDKKY